MYYDSCQFGSFEGKDNRKTVMQLFKRMGHGLPDEDAGMMRAGFLQGLVLRSSTGFANLPAFVTKPCSAAEAYMLFVSITGCFGVDVNEAAKLLEEVIRHQEDHVRQHGHKFGGRWSVVG